MSLNLVLGPLLRYAGARDATVWVETDAPCEVEVLVEGSSHRSHTFEVEFHAYGVTYGERIHSVTLRTFSATREAPCPPEDLGYQRQGRALAARRRPSRAILAALGW
jgi:hypothetical protein